MGYISTTFGDLQISGVEPYFHIHEKHTISRQVFWSIIGDITITELEVLNLVDIKLGNSLNIQSLTLTNFNGDVATFYLNSVGKFDFAYTIPSSNNQTYNSYRTYDPKYNGTTSPDPTSQAKKHFHSWKKYEGFTKVDYYCDCGEKRDSI